MRRRLRLRMGLSSLSLGIALTAIAISLAFSAAAVGDMASPAILATPAPTDETDATVPQVQSGELDQADAPSETITEDSGFNPTSPEVKHLINNWGFQSGEAVVIANFQLITGSIASDILSDNADNVAGVELLIGGRDEGVERGEILLEVAAKDMTDRNLTVQLGAFEAAALRSLDVSAANVGETRYHDTSEAKRAAGERAHVRIVPAAKAHNELEAEAEAAVHAADGGTVKAADIDWRSGSVKVVDTGRTEAELEEWDEELQTSDCHTSQSQYETAGDFNGGRPTYVETTSNNGSCANWGECTVAMPAAFGSIYGYLTAGHCFPDGWGQGVFSAWHDRDSRVTYVSTTLDLAGAAPYWRREDINIEDVGFARRRWSATRANGQIWKYDNNLWRNITAYENEWRAQGYDACHPAHPGVQFAPRDTTYCAEVVDSIVNAHGYDVGTQNFTEVYYPGSTTTSIDHNPGGGSSGGPWFYGSRTYGVHRGYSGLHPGEAYGIYKRWGPIHDEIQFQFGTNGDFICYSSSGSWGVRCNPN